MSELQKYYEELDASGWDVKQMSDIEKLLSSHFEKIPKEEQEQFRHLFKVEQEAFAFQKSPEKGLSYKVAGTKTMEDGTELPYEWPDDKDWSEKDFDYIRSRFDSCKENLFAITEYGLLLYYSGRLKNNKDVVRLLNCLIELAKSYLQKSLPDNDTQHYIIYFRIVLANSFHIANNRKSDKEIQKQYEQLIRFASEVHNTWDVTHASTLRSIIDLTEFAIEYKREFEKFVSLEKYLDQNWKAANELSKTYNWGAIYVCDISQRLANAIEKQKYDWQTFKAEQFEAMVESNIRTENLAAVNFVESALAIYKEQKNKVKIAELSKRYDEVRRMFRLGETRQSLPNEETQKITNYIKGLVEEKTNQEIVGILCHAPMFAELEHINKMADELFNASVLAQLFPSTVIDKFGNSIDEFTSEEEKKLFSFWQAYGFNFQMGTQKLRYFFIEAFKAGKINYEEIIQFLFETWMSKTYMEKYNGYEFPICPLDVVKPGIKLFFDELGEWRQQNEPSFICATDALVTKIEYLLRFMCSKGGIPTFKDREKIQSSDGKRIVHKIKQEKNIDELLRDLEHTSDNPTGFSEQHRKFIQYVLTQKVGSNLRHRVAHGLMDANEYNIENILVTLSIILKISTYRF